MNTDYSAYVPDVIFEKIPIKNLVSCQDYQRSLSEAQILKIVREFDLYQINLVKVSRRDGTNFVFDGQHTIEAVALKSGSRETPVWCMIFDHLCYEHEAHIFAEQQKHHRPYLPMIHSMRISNPEAKSICSSVTWCTHTIWNLGQHRKGMA